MIRQLIFWMSVTRKSLIIYYHLTSETLCSVCVCTRVRVCVHMHVEMHVIDATSIKPSLMPALIVQPPSDDNASTFLLLEMQSRQKK